jgi:hypothetical protein
MEEINDAQPQLLGVNQEINLPLLKIMLSYGILMLTEYKDFNKLNLMRIAYNK